MFFHSIINKENENCTGEGCNPDTVKNAMSAIADNENIDK